MAQLVRRRGAALSQLPGVQRAEARPLPEGRPRHGQKGLRGLGKPADERAGAHPRGRGEGAEIPGQGVRGEPLLPGGEPPAGTEGRAGHRRLRAAGDRRKAPHRLHRRGAHLPAELGERDDYRVRLRLRAAQRGAGPGVPAAAPPGERVLPDRKHAVCLRGGPAGAHRAWTPGAESAGL